MDPLTSVQKTAKDPPFSGVVGHTGEGHRMTLEEGSEAQGGDNTGTRMMFAFPSWPCNISSISRVPPSTIESSPDHCSCQWMLTGGRHVQAKPTRINLGTGFGLSLVDHGRSSSDAMLSYLQFCYSQSISTNPILLSVCHLVTKIHYFRYPMQTDIQQTPWFGWVKRVYGRTPSQNPCHKRKKRNCWAVSHTAGWDAHLIILTEDIALRNHHNQTSNAITNKQGMVCSMSNLWQQQFHREAPWELSFVNPALFAFHRLLLQVLLNFMPCFLNNASVWVINEQELVFTGNWLLVCAATTRVNVLSE